MPSPPPSSDSPAAHSHAAGDTPALIAKIASLQNLREYAELNWSGSFEDYLNLVRKNPAVTRNAYQRVYDMILSYGTEEVYENKKRSSATSSSPTAQHGGDGIFGLDRPLMQLVNVFKSAAQGYGTERRVLLLHGPVGSSKSTIARLLKNGLEDVLAHDRRRALHLRLDRLADVAAGWRGEHSTFKCPMHEEPLHLVPREPGAQALDEAQRITSPQDHGVQIDGDSVLLPPDASAS